MKNCKFFVILLALAAASCTKDMEPVIEPEGPVPGDCTFNLMVDPQVKKTMSQYYTSDFAIGDKFLVFDSLRCKVDTFVVTAMKGDVYSISGHLSDLKCATVNVGYPADRFHWNQDGSFSIDPVYDQPTSVEIVPTPSYYAIKSPYAGENIVLLQPGEAVVCVDVDVDNTNSLTLALTNDSSLSEIFYKDAGESSLEKGKYVFLVPSDQYDNATVNCACKYGNDYTLTTQDVSLSGGESLHLGSERSGEKNVDYEIISESTISGIDEFLENLGTFEGHSTLYKKIVSFISSLVLTDCEVQTSAFSYSSSDKEGNVINLSGRLYVPQSVIDGEDADCIVIANHHTITCNALCPSNYPYIIEAFPAWKNSIVVMPDYHGFGVDAASAQTFIDGMYDARANIDAYDAAVQILKDDGINTEIPVNNFGYSQGALMAVANLRYTALNPEREMTIDKTFAGGGPFDFLDCYKAFMYGEGSHGPMSYYTTNFIILSIVNINENEKFGIDYSSVFRERLASNVQPWILDKNLTVSEIVDSLGTQDPYEVLTHNAFWMVGDESKKIIEAGESYDITGGWDVPEDSELYLFHSTQDDYVPFQSFLAMKEAVGDSDNVECLYGRYGTHEDAVLPFLLWTLRNW